MLLKGDATTIVQEWRSMPPHAGPKMGLASDGQFSPRASHVALDSRSQARLLYLCDMNETAQGKVNVYRSRSNDRLRVKQISIQYRL